MKTLQMNTVTGIREVVECDSDADFLGAFSGSKEDAHIVFSYIDEDFEGDRAFEVSDEIFEALDEKYIIKKL